ncbi:hypothetical protein HHS_06420 [Candidatus Pantoea carbekii]|uniref:Ion-translocating oxidoreductase complex subunit B n=1 Tax=Candidatus Pantoea carbekii TaxID=1235990 RepID=U3U820_9GAMM|nr:hypothetical protein HHS_06420 [Candidatus Pantoea carbekii]
MTTIWISIVVLSILSLIFGAILGYASYYFQMEEDCIIEQINAVLPQNQCAQCGYMGCRLYAEAIVKKKEVVNKCIPGGKQTMLKLAALLNMNPSFFIEDGITPITSLPIPLRTVVKIDEVNCIGCNKCIQVCPVDAIIGAPRTMHTVLQDLCTGCNLCVPHCPTDCIAIQSTVDQKSNYQTDSRPIIFQVS